MTELYYYMPAKRMKTFTVPDSVITISREAFLDNKHLKTLKISKWRDWIDSNSITKIYASKIEEGRFYVPEYQSNMPKLKKIILGNEQKEYQFIDGVLYKDEGKELVCYLASKRDKVFRIPQAAITSSIRLNNQYVEKIIVHSDHNIEKLFFSNWGGDGKNDTNFLPRLKNIVVDAKNPYCASVGGVLFNKEKTRLICYPGGRKASTYTVPKGVTALYDTAFDSVKRKLTVKLPSSVKNILVEGGRKYVSWEDFYRDGILEGAYDNITFAVKKGSKAYELVKRCGLKYKFY